MTDNTFDCNVNRTDGDPTNTMYLINHFLDETVNVLGTEFVPDKDQLNVTNSASGTGSLGLQASQCAAEYGRNPNFMLVDVRIDTRLVRLRELINTSSFTNTEVDLSLKSLPLSMAFHTTRPRPSQLRCPRLPPTQPLQQG